MKIDFLRISNKKFAVKFFVTVTLFLFIISCSFTAFFIYQQGKALKEKLVKNGKLLTGILAYSVRLGVFSEDKRLLENTVEGIFQQENVLEVSVFSLEKQLFNKQKMALLKEPEYSAKKDEKTENEIFDRLNLDKALFFQEFRNRLEFLSPVMAGVGYATEESLLLEENPLRKKHQPIGFVKLTVDKSGLNKTLVGLLLKSVLLGILFLIIGSGGIYFLVKRVTKPLNRLTEGVRSLGMGGEVKKVPVETSDEIGRLAQAFNTMYESLKKRNAEKEELQNQLRHAQKMEAIGTLAGGIAHDFNNIITAIVGYGNLLLMRAPEDPSLKNYVEQILEASERAVHLNQSLLAFSRKQLIDLKPIDLNNGIRNVKKLLSRLIREDIQINLDLAKENLIVMADSGQIDQVLMNLTTNARDAMPDGGTLTIATKAVKLKKNFFRGHDDEKAGRFAFLSVSDTGIGIDGKTGAKILDPFFTTKEVGKGTGLGLSMIYGIIKQHKGYIDMFSEPGKGATFKIYFPLIDLPKEEKKEKGLNIKGLGGQETILFAEDDEVLRNLLKEVLEQAEYTVIEAEDGEDAVNKFIENKEEIQIVLLDVIMPKKNGKEAYEEISKINTDIKTLFLSGYTSDILNKEGIIEEGINFISKPVSPEALLSKVREVLDR